MRPLEYFENGIKAIVKRNCCKVEVVKSFRQLVAHKMSFSGMQMSIFHSKKDKTDPKLQKYKNDTEENINCRENFNEYLFSSTLHGLRYVGDRSISRVERTFFACMFFLVMILSIYFISNLWLKWSLSPMIISLSSKSVSIKDMPFPGKSFKLSINRINYKFSGFISKL